MSAAKAKGTRWESALVAFFRAVGIDAYRPAQGGVRDVGDVHGLGPFVAQAKDWRDWQSAIREGLDGAERQRLAAGMAYGVALVKRARRPVGAGYAVMTVATFARVLRRLRRAEALLAEVSPERAAEHAAATADELNTDDGQGA